MIGMVVSVLVSIAIGYGVIQWAAKPGYSALYTGLEARDASEVVDALQAAAIPYKLDGATGMVMVESGRVHEARLKMASQGLPRGAGIGIEILQQEQRFGTSQFVENARYHHALETELARTISTMQNVKSARVHLAIPKRSVFVRERSEPSASVALNLYGGRTIEQGQVNAIIHLVASSISNMTADKVTVVDQRGRLLSSGDTEGNVAMTAKEYAYTRQVEEDYARRIEHILEPIIGFGKVRATVNADIDFSQEVYKPQNSAGRSKQSGSNASEPGGVKRLTVGVLLDDRVVVEGGTEKRTPLTNEEIQRITTLVKQTVGYDEKRGDLVNVINASFIPAEEPEALPEQSFMDNPMVRNSVKYLATLIIILALIFAIVRPSVKSLMDYTPPPPVQPSPAGGEGGGQAGQRSLGQLEYQAGAIPLPTEHDRKVEFARAMAGHDARRVANVVKDWIGREA